jgi:hypothetical protein
LRRTDGKDCVLRCRLGKLPSGNACGNLSVRSRIFGILAKDAGCMMIFQPRVEVQTEECGVSRGISVAVSAL